MNGIQKKAIENIRAHKIDFADAVIALEDEKALNYPASWQYLLKKHKQNQLH